MLCPGRPACQVFVTSLPAASARHMLPQGDASAAGPPPDRPTIPSAFSFRQRRVVPATVVQRQLSVTAGVHPE